MKIEIDIEEIADVVADRVRFRVLAMLEAAQPPSPSFSVYLHNIGDTKIEVIKEVRAVTGLGLAEAKEIVECAENDLCAVVKRGLSKDDAIEIKERLEKVGAVAAYDDI